MLDRPRIPRIYRGRAPDRPRTFPGPNHDPTVIPTRDVCPSPTRPDRSRPTGAERSHPTVAEQSHCGPRARCHDARTQPGTRGAFLPPSPFVGKGRGGGLAPRSAHRRDVWIEPTLSARIEPTLSARNEATFAATRSEAIADAERSHFRRAGWSHSSPNHPSGPIGEGGLHSGEGSPRLGDFQVSGFTKKRPSN